MEDKLLTAKEAARLLCVTTGTLYKMRREGILDAVPVGMGNRNFRFRQSDITKYLAKVFQQDNQEPKERK